MDELLFIGLLIVSLLIISPILALIAMGRTKRIQQELALQKQKIQQLELRLSSAPPISSSSPSPMLSSTVIASPTHGQQKQLSPTNVQIKATPSAKSEIEAAETPSLKTQGMIDIPSFTTQELQPKANNSPEVVTVVSHFISWLFKGNPLAKIGILLLFLGLAYLLKFSIEKELISPQIRLIFAAVVCIILLGLGIGLKKKQLLYALILQGGAIGGLYITVFAASKLYLMLPYMAALMLMVLICAASVTLAILQRAVSLAMLASIGGYAAPILLSTGGGSHIVLFSYYLMLSLGILVISYWQSWRPLNLIGFIFTYGTALMWGMEYYQPEYYLSCQLLLIANLIIFSLLTQLFANKNRQHQQMLVDNVLLFGPPIISFMLQYVLVEPFYLGAAFSALIFAAIYLFIGYISHKRYYFLGRNLALGYITLGMAFITLAIPLAVSYEWTSIVWAVEGLAILWFGFQQNSRNVIIAGSLLIFVSGMTLLGGLGFTTWSRGSVYMVPVLIICCTFAGVLFRYYRQEKPLTKVISQLFLWLSLCAWANWLFDIADILSWSIESESFTIMAVVVLSAWFWRVVGMKTQWTSLLYCQLLLWLVGYYYLFLDFINNQEPLGKAESSLIWPVLLGSLILFIVNSYQKVPRWFYATMHIATYWLILCFLAVEISWFISLLPWGMTEWGYFIYIMAMVAIILILYWLQGSCINPMVLHKKLYWLATLPLIVLMIGCSLAGNLLDGKLTFWIYIPLLNPLDEAGLFSIVALICATRCIRRLKNLSSKTRKILVNGLNLAIITLSVCWFNGVLLRGLVDYLDLYWSLTSILDSRFIQTTLSIVWTLVALIIMIMAHNKQQRINWFAGAIILGAVIAKLFLIDITNEDGLIKAVTFIVVAVLILVVGYFSPLPPRNQISTLETGELSDAKK